jgi:hypothetical protein
MKWEQDDHNDSRVTDYSEVLQKKYFGKLRDSSGVLILLDSESDVKHIENVELGRVTILVARHILGDMSYAFSHIKMLYTKNESDAGSLVDYLLRKYNPSFNKAQNNL